MSPRSAEKQKIIILHAFKDFGLEKVLKKVAKHNYSKSQLNIR
jgi:hypothetical protein